MSTRTVLTPVEAAACLMAVIERAGGTFAIDEHGYLRADLSPCRPDGFTARPAEIAACIHALRDEIVQLLRARTTTH